MLSVGGDMWSNIQSKQLSSRTLLDNQFGLRNKMAELGTTFCSVTVTVLTLWGLWVRKFPEIYSNLSGNFLIFFTFLNNNHRKNYKISMFLTNNSPDLCVLTFATNKVRQNNLYWASLPRISANSNENYRRYNFRLQLIFPEILNFRKIYNPRHCHLWTYLRFKTSDL